METIDTKNYRLTIEQDNMAESPRTAWDNLGKLITVHSRYALGDENFNNMSDFDDYIESLEDGIYLPVFLYDHSGLSVSISSFSCPFDSGQLGYIYLSIKDIVENFGDASKESIEKAKQCLKSEIKELNMFITGDVYFWELDKKSKCGECDIIHYEHKESLGGIYGYEYVMETIAECLGNDHEVVLKLNEKAA